MMSLTAFAVYLNLLSTIALIALAASNVGMLIFVTMTYLMGRDDEHH